MDTAGPQDAAHLKYILQIPDVRVVDSDLSGLHIAKMLNKGVEAAGLL